MYFFDHIIVVDHIFDFEVFDFEVFGVEVDLVVAVAVAIDLAAVVDLDTVDFVVDSVVELVVAVAIDFVVDFVVDFVDAVDFVRILDYFDN